MITRTLAAALFIGASLTAILTGCSAPEAAETTSSGVPTTSTPIVLPTTNECVDGQATLVASEDGSVISLPEGCDTVYVVASNQNIDLGPTVNLVFEGTGNTVSYTGEAPTLGGSSDDNTVIPR